MSFSKSDPVDLGIIGGGQLGRMTAERAARLGLTTIVLDPDPECPARGVANESIVAAFDDPAGLTALVERSEVTTYDLEGVDTETLARLERRGQRIHPKPSVLRVVQDKLRQRELFAAHGLPVPLFFGANEPTLEDAMRLGFPVVQKARRGGYDGRGVVVMRDSDDTRKLLHVPSLFEEAVPIEMELSVIVARSTSGETAVYPVAEMIFDDRLNLIEGVLFPARVDEALAERARRLALRAVTLLGGAGLFAVELFVGPRGALWLNEIAPRPHNSGHVTIESAATCQFEQHVRAVSGMALGSCALTTPSAMVNIVGAAGQSGTAVVDGLEDARAVRGSRVYLYGKRLVRPGRKMGHITVVDDDPAFALRRARLARERLTLRADEVAA